MLTWIIGHDLAIGIFFTLRQTLGLTVCQKRFTRMKLYLVKQLQFVIFQAFDGIWGGFDVTRWDKYSDLALSR